MGVSDSCDSDSNQLEVSELLDLSAAVRLLWASNSYIYNLRSICLEDQRHGRRVRTIKMQLELRFTHTRYFIFEVSTAFLTQRSC